MFIFTGTESQFEPLIQTLFYLIYSQMETCGTWLLTFRHPFQSLHDDFSLLGLIKIKSVLLYVFTVRSHHCIQPVTPFSLHMDVKNKTYIHDRFLFHD